MLNYHTDFALRVDLVLLALYFAFGALLILYIILRNHHSETRTRKLLAIKQSLFRLFLSGEKACAAVPLAGRSTPGDFVDVETNRQKYTVFFNESEQRLFKDCFITADKIKTLESLSKKSWNKWRRIEAIIALGYARPESALGILEESLYSKDEDVSYFSALAIGQINSARSVTILMDFLKRKPLMRRKVASVLEMLTPDITDEVMKFTNDPDQDVRLWAVRLISKSASAPDIKRVAALTGDPSPDVRAAACECLATLNDKTSKQILVARLKDDYWFVRMRAIRALSKIFGKESIPEILGLINDGSLLVLDSVKTAMTGNMDTALPYMPKLFEGTDDLVKKICIEAIESSGYTIKILRGALSGNKEEKAFAIKILKAMVRANAHLGLETTLKEMDEESRNRILGMIRTYDAGLVIHIEKILTGELNEL